MREGLAEVGEQVALQPLRAARGRENVERLKQVGDLPLCDPADPAIAAILDPR